jgi:hypothetical protein
MYETNCGIAGSKAGEGIRWNKIIGRSKPVNTENTSPNIRPLTGNSMRFAGMQIVVINRNRNSLMSKSVNK